MIEIPFNCSAVVKLPFNPNDEKIELDAGCYNFDYKPTRDVRAKYTTTSLFIDMVDDEEAMNIIQKITPSLYQMLKSGDVDNMYENLETIKDVFFFRFSPETVNQLTKELTSLKYI